jgi:hypothetical protein
MEASWKPLMSLSHHHIVAAHDEKPMFAGQVMPRS